MSERSLDALICLLVGVIIGFAVMSTVSDRLWRKVQTPIPYAYVLPCDAKGGVK